MPPSQTTAHEETGHGEAPVTNTMSIPHHGRRIALGSHEASLEALVRRNRYG